MTSIERTAYPQFKRLTSARVLHVFFTAAADEVAWARERTASAGSHTTYHYVSDTYVALFSRFIPCGVWEAVHLIEGLLANTSGIQP